MHSCKPTFAPPHMWYFGKGDDKEGKIPSRQISLVSVENITALPFHRMAQHTHTHTHTQTPHIV